MAVNIDESIFMGQEQRVGLAHKGRSHYDTVRDKIMSNPCVSFHTFTVNVDVVHFSRKMTTSWRYFKLMLTYCKPIQLLPAFKNRPLFDL